MSKSKKSQVLVAASCLAMLSLFLSDITFSKSSTVRRLLLGEGYDFYATDARDLTEEMKYVMEEEMFDAQEEAHREHAFLHNLIDAEGEEIFDDPWHDPFGTGGYEEPLYDHDEISARALNRLRLLRDPTLDLVHDLRYMMLGHPSAILKYGHYGQMYSYPALISHGGTPGQITRRVAHIGDGLSGPRYISSCLQSLVEEYAAYPEHQNMDVIVLDYFSKATDGLYPLVRRLRARYPDAIIIVLRVWKPTHINWIKDGKRRGSLKDWGDHMSQLLNKTLRYGTEEWFYYFNKTRVQLEWQDFTDRDRILHHVVQEFGVKLFRLETDINPKMAIWKNHDMFYPDYVHVSVIGHRHLYFAIMHFVNEAVNEEGYDPSTAQQSTWGQGDSCHSWYTDGVINVRKSNNLKKEEFRVGARSTNYDSHVVYALSTGMDHPNSGGHIWVNNPFHGPRHLILSYMTTGPAPSKYPTVDITVETLQGTVINATTLVPLTTLYESKLVHAIKTSVVATIPHGEFKLFWSRQETGRLGETRPFRITAVQVVSTDVVEGGVMGPPAYFDSLGQFGP